MERSCECNSEMRVADLWKQGGKPGMSLLICKFRKIKTQEVQFLLLNPVDMNK